MVEQHRWNILSRLLFARLFSLLVFFSLTQQEIHSQLVDSSFASCIANSSNDIIKFKQYLFACDFSGSKDEFKSLKQWLQNFIEQTINCVHRGKNDDLLALYQQEFYRPIAKIRVRILRFVRSNCFGNKELASVFADYSPLSLLLCHQTTKIQSPLDICNVI